jgi:hypothetical protein
MLHMKKMQLFNKLPADDAMTSLNNGFASARFPKGADLLTGLSSWNDRSSEN